MALFTQADAKTLLDNAQNKLDSGENTKNEILDQARKDSDKLIIELNDKTLPTAGSPSR